MTNAEKRAIFTTLLTNALAARAGTTEEFSVAHEGAGAMAAAVFPDGPEAAPAPPLTGEGGNGATA